MSCVLRSLFCAESGRSLGGGSEALISEGLGLFLVHAQSMEKGR